MSIWNYQENPDLNQYNQGLDFHEGQTTSTVPASLRLLMEQMAQYAKAQRLLPLSGKTEKLSAPIALPPQEFLCAIPAAADGVKGDIVFVLNDGAEIKTSYRRADYSGYYVIRFPEGIITDTAAKAVPRGTICHFWDAVPQGWEDITDKYRGRYIEGCPPSECGKIYAGANKSHGHDAQSGDKREWKGVHWDFQTPADWTLWAEGDGTMPTSQWWNRGEHSHDLNLRADGGDAPKPAHIILRLGRKL